MTPELGIEGYRPVRVIGQGGFGTVHLVRDEIHGRDLAVKVLPAGLDDSARRQFDRERRAMGALSGHPAIGTVYTSGFTPAGHPFIAMELLEGGSLADHVQQGPMPVDEVVAIGASLAEALTAAHEAGVLHLDVKPENVLFDRFGTAKIVDFGIAALADDENATASIRATPAFAAPEVLDGHPPTTSADVYGLAVTMYALLMGSSPYAGDSMLTVLRRVAVDPVPEVMRPDAPPALCVLLRRAMEKSPEGRPSSMSEFARQLRAIEAAPRPPSTSAGPDHTVVVGGAGFGAPSPPAAPPTPATTSGPTATSGSASTSGPAAPPLPSPTGGLPPRPSQLADPGPSNVPVGTTPAATRVPPAAVIGAGAGLAVVVLVALVLIVGGNGGSTPATADPTIVATTDIDTTDIDTTDIDTTDVDTTAAPPTTDVDTTDVDTTDVDTTDAPTTTAEPVTTTTVAVSTAEAFNFRWSTDVDDDGFAVDDIFIVFDEIERLCGTWSYTGVAAGTTWTITWFVDGVEQLQWRETGTNTAGSNSFFACAGRGGLPPGTYELIWLVDDGQSEEQVLDNATYVKGDRQPVFVDLQNATGQTICVLNFSPSTARNWGINRLAFQTTLRDGEIQTVAVPSGEYDQRALACNGSVINETFRLQIDADSNVRIEGTP